MLDNWKSAEKWNWAQRLQGERAFAGDWSENVTSANLFSRGRTEFPAGRAPLVLCAAIIAAAFSSGCRGKKCGYSFNRQVSVNLSVPERNWPCDAEKRLTPAEQEIYAVRGAPDMIRFWWKGTDDFSRNMEVPMKIDADIIAKVQRSWIYSYHGDEVIFNSPVHHDIRPINDRLRVVIESGDPESRKYIPDPLGEIEEWLYYSLGMVFRFRDGELIETRRISDPMGRFIR